MSVAGRILLLGGLLGCAADDGDDVASTSGASTGEAATTAAGSDGSPPEVDGCDPPCYRGVSCVAPTGMPVCECFLVRCRADDPEARCIIRDTSPGEATPECTSHCGVPGFEEPCAPGYECNGDTCREIQ